MYFKNTMKLKFLALALTAGLMVGACSQPSSLNSSNSIKLTPVSGSELIEMHKDGRLQAITGTDGVTVELLSDTRHLSLQPVIDAAIADGAKWCLHPNGYAFLGGEEFKHRLTSESGEVKVNSECEVI